MSQQDINSTSISIHPGGGKNRSSRTGDESLDELNLANLSITQRAHPIQIRVSPREEENMTSFSRDFGSYPSTTHSQQSVISHHSLLLPPRSASFSHSEVDPPLSDNSGGSRYSRHQEEGYLEERYQSPIQQRNPLSHTSIQQPLHPSEGPLPTSMIRRDQAGAGGYTQQQAGNSVNINNRAVYSRSDKEGEIVYRVQFKQMIRNYFYSPQTAAGAPAESRPISIGDYVVVEADRQGTDVGMVVASMPLTQLLHQATLAASKGDDAYGVIENGRLVRHATQYEMQQMAQKCRDEDEVIDAAQALASAQNLPAQVLDAEYQFDRQLLTVYYASEVRVDFRGWVRELFGRYRSRIWMKQLFPSPEERMRQKYEFRRMQNMRRVDMFHQEGVFSRQWQERQPPPHQQQQQHQPLQPQQPIVGVNYSTQPYASPSSASPAFSHAYSDPSLGHSALPISPYSYPSSFAPSSSQQQYAADRPLGICPRPATAAAGSLGAAGAAVQNSNSYINHSSSGNYLSYSTGSREDTQYWPPWGLPTSSTGSTTIAAASAGGSIVGGASAVSGAASSGGGGGGAGGNYPSASYGPSTSWSSSSFSAMSSGEGRSRSQTDLLASLGGRAPSIATPRAISSGMAPSPAPGAPPSAAGASTTGGGGPRHHEPHPYLRFQQQQQQQQKHW